jgi:DNA uptake protein ComE-like DNA-binding protein
MRRLAGTLLLALALLAPAIPLTVAQDAHAGEERKEVTKRIEMNNATPEQLAATGAVNLELAKKIIKLRDELGGFQSYDDLQELNIPKEIMDKLRINTTIKGIASDCTC